jgi:subtilisin family serine protease
MWKPGRAVLVTLAVVILSVAPAQGELVKLPPRAQAVPGRYLVLDPAHAGWKSVLRIHAEVVQELPLENLPSGWLVRMSPEVAEAAAREGYTVIPEAVFKIPGSPGRLEKATPTPWHLDRDDQRVLPLDGLYHYSYTGRGVRAYVLDTGSIANPDIADRLETGVDFIGDGRGPNADCGDFSHGTDVASLLSGKTYGVAKGVTVIPVRVGTCQWVVPWSKALQGLDWILSDVRRHPKSHAVVNMSFAGAAEADPFEPLFKLLDQAGVLLVDVAANSNDEACSHAPAVSRYTITAGGTDRQDSRFDPTSPQGSGFGSCVDLFAPGGDIHSAAGPDDSAWTSTGTSDAAPQVSATLALLWEQFPKATSATIRQLLLANATPGILVAGSLGAGSPNLLLYAGPFREAFASFVPAWSPAQHRFSVQLTVTVPGGGLSPAATVQLYRGSSRRGQCQGKAFGTAHLDGGSGALNVKGFAAAPTAICARTSLGTVIDQPVRISH